MKVIFNIISIIIIIAVAFLASLNSQTVFDLSLINAKGVGTIVSNVHFVPVVLLVFILGTIAGVLWATAFYSSTRIKLKEYQRKLEKTSVQSSEDCSKVEVLEAKIATLEKALQSALENK